MNYDQIEKGEVRIFPFYKGQYMGTTNLGFSNKKSAQKFMKDIPSDDIYNELGGKEEYFRTHNYVYELDKHKLHTFNPPSANLWDNRRFDGIYGCDYDKRVFVKDLPLEIIKDIEEVGFCSDYENKEKVRAFEEKWNLFPYIHTDFHDYEKIHRIFMRDKVQYREGILEITVRYLDEENKKDQS